MATETKNFQSFQIHEKDTGSADVQIALLTQRITQLTEHLKTHVKDHSSRRGPAHDGGETPLPPRLPQGYRDRPLQGRPREAEPAQVAPGEAFPLQRLAPRLGAALPGNQISARDIYLRADSQRNQKTKIPSPFPRPVGIKTQPRAFTARCPSRHRSEGAGLRAKFRRIGGNARSFP